MSDLTNEITTDLPPLPTGSDPDIRWLLVSGERDYIQAYLYEHAVIVSHNPGVGYGPQTLVIVHGRPGRNDVDYYAEYQANRLRSGMMRATVHPTFAQAYMAAAQALEGE